MELHTAGSLDSFYCCIAAGLSEVAVPGFWGFRVQGSGFRVQDVREFAGIR